MKCTVCNVREALQKGEVMKIKRQDEGVAVSSCGGRRPMSEQQGVVEDLMTILRKY